MSTGADGTAKASEPRRRVLVVDDEEAILRTFRRILEPMYDVTTTASPVVALDLMVSASSFDVVVCDMRMPEMTGTALHEAITERRPELAERFLFVTASHVGDGALAGRPVLHKPVSRDGLREAIARVVGECVVAQR